MALPEAVRRCALGHIIERAMVKSPARRYATTSDMARAIRDLLAPAPRQLIVAAPTERTPFRHTA